MDIELYRTFLAICDTGSFTSAAHQVGRTQSAISQQVRRLEEALGQPLFERQSNTVSLNEYGKSLIGLARSIVDSHTEVLASFKRAVFQGLIVVGIAEAYVSRILNSVTEEFKILYPTATLSIVLDDSVGLSRRIAEGSVDLAFVTKENCPTSGPEVFRDRLVLVGPSEGDLHKLDPLPLIMWDPRNQDEVLLVSMLESVKRRHHVACVCRNVAAQHALVSAGLGAAVLVEGSIVEGERAYLEDLGFRAIKELTIRLERSPVKRSREINSLEQHYLDYFARKWPITA
jgi:DNA-binding transcriptional LysR family regulator